MARGLAGGTHRGGAARRPVARTLRPATVAARGRGRGANPKGWVAAGAGARGGGGSPSSSSGGPPPWWEAAVSRTNAALEGAGDDLRRAVRGADRRWGVRTKVGAASEVARKGFREAWLDVDQRFQVKRRVRSAVAEVPQAARSLKAFSRTPAGQVGSFVLFFYIFSSGAWIHIVNLSFTLMLFLPLVASLAFNKMAKQAAERVEQNDRWAQPGQEAGAYGGAPPFGNAAGFRQQQQQYQQQQGGAAGSGDVIDISYETIDDEE